MISFLITRFLARCENCSAENLAMYGGLEADVPGAAGARHGPVVCLLGGGPQDAAGDQLLAKKLKKGDRKDGGHWAC